MTGSGGDVKKAGRTGVNGATITGENLKTEWANANAGDERESKNSSLLASHSSETSVAASHAPDMYEQSNFGGGQVELPQDLSHLTLARLGLTSIIFPPGLKVVTLENLVSLDLSYNQLHSLNTPALSALPHLKHLDVSNNLLVRLATGGDNHLPATLESLDVSCNNLARICGLDKCMDLRMLNLSNNKLKLVTGLEFLASLSNLDLSENSIANAVGIRTLSCNLNLRNLKMKGNPLSETRGYRPTVICLLPHVKSIDGKGLPRTGGVKRHPSKKPEPNEPPKQKSMGHHVHGDPHANKENERLRLEKAKKQAEADRQRMLSYQKILESRATEPEYAKIKGPRPIRLSLEEQEKLLEKLTHPIYPARKKVVLPGHAKLAFGRSVPQDELAEKKKAAAGKGGATSVAALRARLAAAKKGGGGGAKKVKVEEKSKGVGGGAKGGNGEEEGLNGSHDVSDDIAQLHREVMRLQEMQETGLSLVQAQEKHLGNITGDLAEARARLSTSPSKVLASSGGSMSAVDLISR